MLFGKGNRTKGSGIVNAVKVRQSFDTLRALSTDSLNDAEILYCLFDILGCPDAGDLADALVARFGSLPATISASSASLMLVGGMTPQIIMSMRVVRHATVAALRIDRVPRPILGDHFTVIGYLRADMGYAPLERFRVLFLDSRNGLVADELMGVGSENACPVYPREVVRRALSHNAVALLLVHNHPSGSLEPSRDDVAMTQAIAEACRACGVALHDHIIVSAEGFTSFRERRLL